MDKELFKSKLEQFAELSEMKPSTSPGQRADEVIEIVLDNKMIEINSKFNPTLGIKIKKIKDQIKPCRLGCGQMISNQTLEIKKQHKPFAYTQTKCVNCKRYLHPNGHDLIIGEKQLKESLLKYFLKQETK